MNDQNDSQLLRAYTERRSESAFAELVRRHVDLVYSAALRMVCDSHLAQDVTQGVFVALAKNAIQLTDRPVLSGWLHRTAQNIAAQTVRTEVRRRAREQEAAAMNELLSAESEANWEHIAPHLDDALGELNEADRDALMLRYFERKSAREMAEILGVSDDAAQKRVSRAVERLREFFTKRGVTVGTSGLVAVISASAVQAAPVGLAITISTAAALAGTAIQTSTAVAATKIIAMTTLQKTLITATIAAASVVAPLVIQHQAQVKLREENAFLRRRIDQLAQLRAENERLSNRIAEAESSRRLPNDQFSELLRLRGEVGSLRRQTNELGTLQTENQRLRSSLATANTKPEAGTQPTSAQESLPKESWTFVGYAEPDSAFQTAIWAMNRSDAKTILASLAPDGEMFKELSHESEERIVAKTKGLFEEVKAIKIMNREVVSDNEVILIVKPEGANLPPDFPLGGFRLQRVGNDWKLDGMIHDKGRPSGK